MTVTQTSAALIGLTVLLGVIIPGGIRYLLLGGVVLLLAGVIAFGNMADALQYFRR